MTSTDDHALEERLQYTFSDKALLKRALTHSSLSGGDAQRARS